MQKDKDAIRNMAIEIEKMKAEGKAHKKDAHRTGHRKTVLRQAVFDQVLQDGGAQKEA